MNKKVCFFLTTLLLLVFSTNTAVYATTPNYFDATINMYKLRLVNDGDPLNKGEIYFVIKNRGGITLYNTRNNITKLGLGNHDITNRMYTCEHYVSGLDYFIVEVWDKDGAYQSNDDCLFRGKLDIKIKSTEGTVYYTDDYGLTLKTCATRQSFPPFEWVVWDVTDYQYAHFEVYNYVPPNVADPWNELTIELIINYYYSNIG
ncbi:MAG: hypothetical protein ACTSSG_08585 [Candidatus Heimdallarchaeaceae archaeon]